MSVEYTPDTDHVRDIYVQGRSLLSFYSEGRLAEDMRNGAAFDRWLAQHDREVAEQALRDAAEYVVQMGLEFGTDRLAFANARHDVADWLNARADRIEREGGEE